jgi:RNA polymerase sigma factor (sigma-70 family)
MSNGQLQVVVRHAQRLAETGEPADGGDGSLLRRFLNAGEAAAFEALVRRHGPMVLGVCRRVLRDEHSAEDAFQATFLVLFRRARALCRQRGSLAGWLYTVASRVALKARADAARRRLKEGQVVDMPRGQAQPEQVWPDLQPVLDEELNRLPETYRAAVVLCYLQGKTNDEAAQLLGWPVGTVKSRLARARDLLRGRLARRGVTVTPALLGATLAARATATLPSTLVDATVRTALGLANAAGVAVPAASAPLALAEGVLKGMLAARLALGTGLLAAALAGVMAAAALAQPPRKTPPRGPVEPVAPDPGAAKAKPGQMPKPGPAERKPGALDDARAWDDELCPLKVSGRVLSPEGKPLRGADVVVMTPPWRYIQHAAPVFAAGYEILVQGKAGKDGVYELRVARDRWVYSMQGAGPLQVVAAAPGHGPAWRPLMTNRDEKECAGLDLTLPPLWVLRGRLIDLQGRAAAGVKLSAVRVGKKAPAMPTEGPWEFLGSWDGLEEYQARAGAGIRVGRLIRDFRAPTGLHFWAPPGKLPFWPEPAVTDAAGRFRLKGLGRGQAVALLVQDDRFALQVLDFPADAGSEVVTRAAVPPRWIEGTVVAADTGKPLAGALVHVDTRVGPTGDFSGHADWKGRRLVTRGWGFYDHFTLFSPAVRTDAAGRFRVNPFLGDSPQARGGALTVTAAAPDGAPYLSTEETVAWPRGAVKQAVRLALRRGVLVRGKVTEKASGQPVARARVDFWSRGLKLPERAVYPGPVLCGKDGDFHLVVPAGKSHLLVNAPRLDNGWDPEFVGQKIPVPTLTADLDKVDLIRGAPVPLPDREPHCYPCAWTALDLRPGAAPVDLTITLRRKAGR